MLPFVPTLGFITRVDNAIDALKSAQKTKTVIGHYDDVIKYKGLPGYNILDNPRWNELKDKPLNWWYEVNKPFLDEAVEKGDEIIFATDPLKAKAGTWFEAELEYLNILK